MVFVFVLSVLLPALALCSPQRQSRSIEYKNCGPDVIKDITITPCVFEPCTFSRGINVTLDVTFVSEEIASAVNAEVYALLDGVPLPHTIPNADGCNDCNLHCPLQPGEHHYQNALPILSIYPDVFLAIKWELVDEQQQQLLCFEFPAGIQG